MDLSGEVGWALLWKRGSQVHATRFARAPVDLVNSNAGVEKHIPPGLRMVDCATASQAILLKQGGDRDRTLVVLAERTAP